MYEGIKLISMQLYSGLALNILKIESCTHMGHLANIIIKDIIHIFASINKNLHILLMEQCHRERCVLVSLFPYDLWWKVSEASHYLTNDDPHRACHPDGHC